MMLRPHDELLELTFQRLDLREKRPFQPFLTLDGTTKRRSVPFHVLVESAARPFRPLRRLGRPDAMLFPTFRRREGQAMALEGLVETTEGQAKHHLLHLQLLEVLALPLLLSAETLLVVDGMLDGLEEPRMVSGEPLEGGLRRPGVQSESTEGDADSAATLASARTLSAETMLCQSGGMCRWISVSGTNSERPVQSMTTPFARSSRLSICWVTPAARASIGTE